MIVLSEAQRDEIRGDYAAGRLDPVHVVPGLYRLPERLITIFPEAGLDQYPTTTDLLATAKMHMLAQLAAIRWGKCQLMPYDGETAYADAALAVVTAKIRVLEESGSTDPVNFKLTATAWRSWTLAQVKAYGVAIDAHIQACFDNEAALAYQIGAAADMEALNAIDLEAGWPS